MRRGKPSADGPQSKNLFAIHGYPMGHPRGLRVKHLHNDKERTPRSPGEMRLSDAAFLPGPPPRHGGGDRDRTDDLLVANQVLSQLSYTPIIQGGVNRGR